uniref:Mucin-5B-like isoform X2 n=1 Tax=Pogona vitticeps TaxID=103695 RepID=A0ABM5F8L8_9SAUR
MKKGGQLWILCLLCSCCRSKTIVQMVQRSAVTASVCSTWGNFHFQTFDHTTFDFPGLCHYVFASHCKDEHQDFNIEIIRSIKNGMTIYFTATIDGVLLEVKEPGITVDGKAISLPFSLKSILIEDAYPYLQVTSRLGLTLKWNWGDTLLLGLEDTYKGKICGLCGNYDGSSKNDLFLHGHSVAPWQFGNLQKVEDPANKCPDVSGDMGKHASNSHQQDYCKKRYKSKCKKVLSHFGNCSKAVSVDDYQAICVDDMCSCSEKSSHSDLVAKCVCSTLSQYARDCVLRGGNPGKWRSKELCFQKCPNNLVYKECGNPCVDTCFNPERSKLCKAPCADGCFCPEGTILDDISSKKCIPAGSCPCSFQGNVFTAGNTYSIPCQNCTCTGGRWSCISLPCSGNCKIEGGAHITTFDKKEFVFHGNCQYVLAKDTDRSFVVIVEMFQCGISDTMTCLKNALITLGAMNIRISSEGDVYINNVITVLPITKDGIILFRPSTFYVNVVTPSRVQIQVQLKPIMQLFITVDETYQNRTSGLCGNFNNVQTDDFRTASGIVEDSASAFGNSWKTMASCANVQDNFEDPCQKKTFGQHWCGLLLDSTGIFAGCHLVSDPAPYVKNCIYDICNAEKSQEALCSVFSAYTRDCASKGIYLKGWRSGICDATMDCPKTMEYSYEVKFCNNSCRSLREPDTLCNVHILPVDGCTCPEGTYLTNEEKCVSPEDCPCYYKGMWIQAGDSFQKDDILCKCIQGQLDCIGKTKTRKDCPSPMYYFDCSSAGPSATGSECQKSCETQDMQCYATECVSGCLCPDGLVSNGNGSCIEEEQCPCAHGGNYYMPGTSIMVNCNTCKCQKRQWNCTKNPCQGICTVYGNGHYVSFDGAKFDFRGDCDYILVQDFCPNNLQPGTFRIVTQHIACGKSFSVCSLKISIFLEDGEIRLVEGQVEELTSKTAIEKSYKIYLMGMYIKIEIFHGMTFIWDMKTTVIIQVTPSFQGRVCGLCGNFDNSPNNDFTTRGQSVEMHAQAFGNSWKVTSSCSDTNKMDLCANQPSKLILGQKQCGIIKSEVFGACHSKINPTPYYESCVSDFCGCDSVGDCECFCTAVAAYSQSCNRAGICIDWRNPKNCPVLCDYYNPPNKREWQYKPCGEPCLRTCRNPGGKCDNILYSLEGCFPVCSAEKPYYDEEKRDCVSVLQCTSCDPKERLCMNKSNDCLCCYNKKTYSLNELIYNKTVGDMCSIAVCGPGGNIIDTLSPCGTFLTDILYAWKSALQSGIWGWPAEADIFIPSFPSQLSESLKNRNLRAKDGKMSPTTAPAKQEIKTTPCICNVNGLLISNDSSQFVTMDASGWCIYAFCNKSCQTEFMFGECISFLNTTIASKVAMMSSRPCKGDVQNCEKEFLPYSRVNDVPAFTSGSDCTDLIPPRKFQEIWKFGSCQIATCLGGKHIKVSDVQCPPQKIKLCVNGLPLVKSHDASGCCEVSECQCACNGWGNQHYITFDGSYYNFHGNCSYILMRPIRPRSQNFWIQLDNHYCAASGRAICSMALFIFYNHSTVILTRGTGNGEEVNLVLYNNKEVTPHFSNDGFDITTSGQYVMVKIPEIGLYVTYTRLAFYISLPFRTFYNNTEGLCGTCNNKKADDAMKRNGKIVDSFTEMAKDWKVMDLVTRHCDSGQDPKPSASERSPSKAADCAILPLCKLIWSFTECHTAVPPRPYYDACITDGCTSPKQNTECENLRAYATLCGFNGICVEWRSKTDRMCEHTCSQDQIYKPCGMKERITCSSGRNPDNTIPLQPDIPQIFVEGCFCPDGLIQLKDHDSVCVPVCGCQEPDGLLREPGESWEKDCQVCTCNRETLSISCSPHICAKSPPITCSQEGFVLVVRRHPEDPCCTEVVCECDVKFCPSTNTECKPGFQIATATSKNACCPTYFCKPKNVCVSQEIEYQPGSLVHSESCEECVCTRTQDPKTKLNQIQCTPMKCSVQCQQGFRYIQEEGKCCGECIQTACVAEFSSGIMSVQVGETYKDPKDNCTQYLCTKLSDRFVLSSTIIACQVLDQSDCVPGTIQTTPDGCCKTCILLSHDCKINLKKQYIDHNGCKSAFPIMIPSCEGSCDTYSVYSFVTHKMTHRCTCCHVTKYHEVTVDLICSKKKKIKYTYLHVDECGCVETKCPT